MTAALWNGELAVVFMKLKKGWHVEKTNEENKATFNWLENNTIGNKQTNTSTFD